MRPENINPLVPQCLSVVMPAYNEEHTLIRVVDRVLALPFVKEIVIVDDCSRDATGAIADDLAGREPRIVSWVQRESLNPPGTPAPGARRRALARPLGTAATRRAAPQANWPSGARST